MKVPLRMPLAVLLGLLLHGVAPAMEPSAGPDFLGPVREKTAQERESVLALYRDLHAAPELSFHEEKTAARLAEEMRAAGFDVTEKVGGWGVVCVLKNGPGKTLLVRTDMDGLPVEEQTGLPYASKVRTKDEQGRDVAVMHACGHDFHMACWVGTARALASMKDRWQGTLVFIAQPAEERGAGALAMLKDGLFSRFPKPDLCIAMHGTHELPAGTLGLTSGAATANSDSIDLIVRGLGGHGAMPDKTKDPIVLASQIVLALQTIRGRELAPQEPAVVTVGSIHGGTKHNIIPDEVRLQLTVRTFNAETRKKTLDAIARIARGQAISAGIPGKLMPELKLPGNGTPMLSNDPATIERLRALFVALHGKDAVRERPPMMGGEDFSRYGMTDDKIPVCMFWVGVTPAAVMRDAEKSGQPVPSLHSPFFHPDAEAALPVGTSAMSAAVLELIKN